MPLRTLGLADEQIFDITLAAAASGYVADAVDDAMEPTGATAGVWRSEPGVEARRAS